MQTYIITMDMENELSEAAASALNGRFFACPQNYQAIWDQVSDYLSDKGFPHGIAQDVFEAVEYFAQNFHSENWPSKDLNLFAAAVSVEHSVEDQGCADLLHLLRNKDDMEASFEDYGVVCGRGRNPTLRLWPAIFSGEIDVFPSERRNMGQEIGR